MQAHGSLDPALSLLKHVFSTITSPASLEVIVLYRDYDFNGVEEHQASRVLGPFRKISQVQRGEEALRHHRQFRVFQEVQKVQDFQLVLCADVWHHVGEYSVQVLEKVVKKENAKGVFDNFSSKPIVIHSPRVTHASIREELYAAGCNIAPGLGQHSGHPLLT